MAEKRIGFPMPVQRQSLIAVAVGDQCDAASFRVSFLDFWLSHRFHSPYLLATVYGPIGLWAVSYFGCFAFIALQQQQAATATATRNG